MLTPQTIVAIDQGTSGTTVVVLGEGGRCISRAHRAFPSYFPRPGWVEQDVDEIWDSVLGALAEALDASPLPREAVAAIGITNQRETCLIADRASGRCEHRALVWQDRRTTEQCAALEPHAKRVRAITGLVIDPYFSASKVSWLLDAHPELRRDALGGSSCFLTIDGFLVQRLSGGYAPLGAVMEATNASRTLLMDIRTRTWSQEMCELFQVPTTLLPSIVPSAGVVAHTRGVPGLPDGIPISGIAGDQHAALFGQGCIQKGDAKCTYGTGAFVLCNTGAQMIESEAGLLSTLAWQIGGHPTYALEGACFIAGAAVQWLRDGLGLINEAKDVESLAESVLSTDGVYFVPALTGLGAPYWDPAARGLFCGITRGTTKAHFARATLEAIALQVDDLLRVMQSDLTRAGSSGLSQLRADGGASRNNLLMQMQADVSGLRVDRPTDIESTARGAGMLAGLGAGLFASVEEAVNVFEVGKSFQSSWSPEQRVQKRTAWEQAVARARSQLIT